MREEERRARQQRMHELFGGLRRTRVGWRVVFVVVTVMIASVVVALLRTR